MKTILLKKKSLLYIVSTAAVFCLMYSFFSTDPKNTPIDITNVKKPKHIIVIDICSLRADHVGSYGYSRDTTPSLSAFGKDAMQFNSAWTEGGWCLPSYASILTGVRADTHKLTHLASTTKLSPDIKTVAEVMKEGGYKTALFSGSRHLVKGLYGLERGFDTYSNPYTSKDSDAGSASYEKNKAEVYSWIQNNKNNPFYLYITIDDLHSPYAYSGDRKKFNKDCCGILDTTPPDMYFGRVFSGDDLSGINPAEKDIYAKVQTFVSEFNKDKEKNLGYLNDMYDADISHLDELTGELLTYLKSQGVYDDTLIIITADHGESLGENGIAGHHKGIYETILHVPLFIRYPGVTQTNTETDHLTERIDIPATILDSVGLLSSHKDQYTGSSLIPLLVNPATKNWKEYIFANSKPTLVPSAGEPSIEERAVRNDRYKLIWYRYKEHQYELYDLKRDPQEANNLITILPGIAYELKKEMEKYVQSVSK